MWTYCPRPSGASRRDLQRGRHSRHPLLLFCPSRDVVRDLNGSFPGIEGQRVKSLAEPEPPLEDGSLFIFMAARDKQHREDGVDDISELLRRRPAQVYRLHIHFRIKHHLGVSDEGEEVQQPIFFYDLSRVPPMQQLTIEHPHDV